MTKRIKKNITIDNLAGMVQRGFDSVDRRFDKVENTLKNFRDENSLEHEEIKMRLSQIVYRFELEEVEKRLKRVETKLGIK